MRTIPVPYVNTRKAEELFRHRVLRLLKDKGLLSEERIQLLFSWREVVLASTIPFVFGRTATSDRARCPLYVESSREPHPDAMVSRRPRGLLSRKGISRRSGSPIHSSTTYRYPGVCLRWAALRGSPATSDSFEAAPKRTIGSSDRTDPSAEETFALLLPTVFSRREGKTSEVLEHLEKRDRHSRAPPPAQPVSVS